MPLRWRRRRADSLSADEAYALWAPSYGEPPNPFQRLEDDSLRELLPPIADRTVLDLGCGRGRIPALAEREGARLALGIDRVLSMLARPLTAGQALLAAADARALPLAAGSFDVVTCSLVLGHLADPSTAIAEAERVLKPGGIFLLSDFHPAAVKRGWRRTFTNPRDGAVREIEHHTHLRADYSRHLENAGLVVEDVREPQWEGIPVVLALRTRKPL